jgi:hypothetical protein
VKNTSAIAILICSLLSPHVKAQRGPVGGTFGSRGFGNSGFQPFSPFPSFSSRGGQRGLGNGSNAGLGLAAAYGDPGEGVPREGYQQPPIVLVAPPEPPPPPPPPAQPRITQYNWPKDMAPSATTYSLVRKDGRVHLAIAVWTQDQNVHYIAPDGEGGSIPLGAIDRDATMRLAAQGNLKLWLPASGTEH